MDHSVAVSIASALVSSRFDYAGLILCYLVVHRSI